MYRGDAERFVALEAGDSSQNLRLQAVDLGLGAVVLGSFGRGGLASVRAQPPGETPLFVAAVGRLVAG